MSEVSSELEWRSGCPVSAALDVFGDRWSLLIIRDLLVLGPRTYSDFRESSERIATNTLAARLKLLTDTGLIERVDPEGAARGNAYRLTMRGEALRPVVAELFRWSQDHLAELHTGMHLDPLDL